MHRGLAALMSVAAVVAAPAAAQAACPSTPTAKVFQAFGDSADYSLVPGGGFESGATGWSLSGASVARGNETYAVGGAGASSLAISPGGQAVSPAICVDVARPKLRLFARRTSGSWGVLLVKLRWREPTGAVNETVIGAMTGGTSWQPSPGLSLATTLPLWNSGQTLSSQIVLDPDNYGGGWAVDDVYADPYRRG